jgi:YidC/Oxa1 family membrane protein insertase
MERSSITKWLFIGLAVFLFWTFGKPLLFGGKQSPFQPQVNDWSEAPMEARPAEDVCSLKGDRFEAVLSTRGASLKHLTLTDQQRPDYRSYEKSRPFMGANPIGPMDLVTTKNEELPKEQAGAQLAPLGLETRMPLHGDLRVPGADDKVQQVRFDSLDWKIAAQDGKSCTFTYQDDSTSLTKTITATGKPFQMQVALKVENLSAEPKKHRFTFEQSAWRTKAETEGSLGRQSEFMTEVVASTTAKTERQVPGDFEPDAFKKPEFTSEHWRRTAGDVQFVAVSSSYFSKIAIPLTGPVAPSAETRIEEYWNWRAVADKSKDPNYGHVYRARLAYPEVELKPHESATYELLTFHGPKERQLLSALNHGTDEVLNLGKFAPIARVLIQYLYWLKGVTGTWGVAIILLTFTIRTALFPLSLSQIKSSVAMRKLKPEMDALNEKYKDDAAQRGLAIQELWRKNKVTNPVLGCLPMLLQMPVWWALYTSLQTAVELYHEKFLWFADLSAPDRFFIIPIVLGGSSFIQQKLMPPQGDPQQQKMMMYMMPALFTFMMLFLPSGLGVYMLTNTWLGIGQQLLVERYLKAKAGASSGTIEVREKTSGGDDKAPPALGKGKARARG